ncbi:hypothetical protein Lser_V15G05831 [Lactuca serriola]
METRERLAVERISLKVEMGIRSLDNNRQVDHKEFMAAAERLISEVSAIKDNLQAAIADQSTLSQKLIVETHTTYESTISILHATINKLQRFLSSNFHGPEILQLTKEIHRLLFNTSIPDNQQLAEVLKAHFQEVCAKVDGLKQWLEESLGLNSSREGSEKDHREEDYEEDHHSNSASQKIPSPQPSPPHQSPPPQQNIVPSPERPETPPPPPFQESGGSHVLSKLK